MQVLSVKQAKNIKPQSFISEKHKRSLKGVYIDLKKMQAIVSASKKNSHTYVTVDSWDFRKTPQNDAAARARATWERVLCCSNCSWRIQHDTNAATS